MILAAKFKNINLLLALVLVTFFTTLQSSSCSKSDDVITSSNTVAIAGSFRVTFYWDKKDETSKLSGYSFVFGSGGQITATKGTAVVTGNWSESSNRLTINFGADPVLGNINADWLKVEKTATSIKLKDDNPLQDDQLTFTLN